MEWVKEFYDKQFEMMVSQGMSEPGKYHEETLKKVEKLAGREFNSILELGAGGGEFAATAAKEGYSVTAVELVPSRIENAKRLKEQMGINDRLTIIEGSFYEVELNQQFDLVCYLDGFGIGEDEDQLKLLQRMSSWLKPEGIILMDVYMPWYWSKSAGQEMEIGKALRRYDFDFQKKRMLDTWFEAGKSSPSVTQSLKCYAPDELEKLLASTDLKIDDIVPGGAVDYETLEYHENVEIEEAMSYMVKLIK